MHVVATAGHVDHGKSTLVQALTGADPDRLEEEHRRGLSIELGYCWTSMPRVGDVAFVDVPGHERFIATMLSGVGPVPAVLFVVAADDPWMPQAAEHLAAIDALGVSNGVLAITRSDLADPGPALARASAELEHTSLRDAPSVTVCGRTGEGLQQLRDLVADMVVSLPEPDARADVRLWVDRCFHVRGAGTVVTGTLTAGRIAVGDRLALGEPAGESTVRVRGVQCLDRPVRSVQGVARVALNLTGSAAEGLDRNSVLVTPQTWLFSDVVDVRVSSPAGRLPGRLPERFSGRLPGRLPERPLLHIGATSVATHVRPLAGDLVRLRLDRVLPLRIGDRALLRDPGSRQVWGVTVLDPAPDPLRRRGAAQARATELALHDGTPDGAQEVRRRGLVRLSALRRIGVDVAALRQQPGQQLDGVDLGNLVVGDWVLSAAQVGGLRARLEELLRDHDRHSPLDLGLPVAAAAKALGLPSPELVQALVRAPLTLSQGRVMTQRAVVLPKQVNRALAELERDLRGEPFSAPTAHRLRDLGLDARAIAAATRAGRLLKLSDGIVLLQGADRAAASWLGELPQPFTTSEARVRLRTSRRVALPLLAHLDRIGLTQRLADDRRTTLGDPEAAGADV
ncbi:MAG TPA: SelB C-terminal domain-containing protein [Nocardioidaceae bacterium]|nr:SelB C-terminal domain-containing protein [Nocardioidaceae bacterium]